MREKTSKIIYLSIFLLSSFVFFVLFNLNIKFNSGGLSGFVAASFIPLVKENIKEPEISAEGYLSVFVNPNGEEKILLEKNTDTIYPIASITKLLTAVIASDFYKKDTKITIPESLSDSVLITGDNYNISNLLTYLLVSSSNNTANILAKGLDKEKFIQDMNKRLVIMETSNTFFVNPTGIDEENPNHSTARDLFKISKYILDKYPEIFEKTKQSTAEISDFSGFNKREIKSTDILLDDKDLSSRIIGGKTGETPKAKQALLLLVESKNNKGYIFNVVLKSNDRFGDMKKIINFIDNSYNW